METEEVVVNLEAKDVRKGANRVGGSLNLWHLSGLREIGLGKILRKRSQGVSLLGLQRRVTCRLAPVKFCEYIASAPRTASPKARACLVCGYRIGSPAAPSS